MAIHTHTQTHMFESTKAFIVGVIVIIITLAAGYKILFS